MYVPVVFLTNKTLTVGHHQMSQSVDLWNQAPGLQIKGPSDKIIMLIHSCYIILLWYTFFFCISVHNRSLPDILANFHLLQTFKSSCFLTYISKNLWLPLIFLVLSLGWELERISSTFWLLLTKLWVLIYSLATNWLTINVSGFQVCKLKEW